MNAWLSWHPNARYVRMIRAALQRGTHTSRYFLSVIGACTALGVLALWLLPSVRSSLAERLMPAASEVAQANDAQAASASDSAASDNDGAFHISFEARGANAVGGFVLEAQSGIEAVAKMISPHRVSAEARDDHVLASDAEQNLVTSYLARRYRVAQEPVSALVRAAFETGQQVGLDPLLLLAVMAIESSFNPYAESNVGAQGLMQVMSKVHTDKLRHFGGPDAALQPLANISVGALILKDCIARGGSLAVGLRLYNGATSPGDNGYGAKVISERDRLRDVVRARKAVTASATYMRVKHVQLAMSEPHTPTGERSAAPASSAVAAPAAHDTLAGIGT